MSDPIEVSLKYRDDGNGIVSFLVEPISNAEYVWQKCEFKTANWKTVCTTTSNLRTETIGLALNNGDKYRCVVLVNGVVTHYSNAFLVSAEKFSYKNSDNQANNRNSTRDRYYKQKEQSVSDTDGMDGLAFEQYCSDVLRENGFSDVKVTQGSGDYGIDILAKKDSISYAIQCKCYADRVSNRAVQEAFSGKSFYGCMVAAVLTNSYFTESAKETAKRNAVLLWDRDCLDQMIRKSKTSHSYDYTYGNKNESQDSYNQSAKPADKTSGEMLDFFKGCSDFEQVKTRYRTLMKTYHPDNVAGDAEYSKIIISQYEALKKRYGR